MHKRINYQLIILVIAVSTVSAPTLFSNPDPQQEKQQQQQQQQSAYAASLTSDLKQEIKQQMMKQDSSCPMSDGCKTAAAATAEGQQTTSNNGTGVGFNGQGDNQGQFATSTIVSKSPLAGNNTATPSIGTLTVNKHVKCNSASGCPTADKFNISVPTSNGSSLSFNGSESGTTLRINPPFSVSYQVTENNPPHGFVAGTMPLPAGSAPFGIAFNPNNGNMYVTNFNSDSVSVINPSTNTVVATIPVGSAPFGIAFNPNNGNMYVTNAGDKTISVISPLTTTYSGGCNGTIDAGQSSAICNITTTYGK